MDKRDAKGPNPSSQAQTKAAVPPRALRIGKAALRPRQVVNPRGCKKK